MQSTRVARVEEYQGKNRQFAKINNARKISKFSYNGWKLLIGKSYSEKIGDFDYAIYNYNNLIYSIQLGH